MHLWVALITEAGERKNSVAHGYATLELLNTNTKLLAKEKQNLLHSSIFYALKVTTGFTRNSISKTILKNVGMNILTAIIVVAPTGLYCTLVH